MDYKKSKAPTNTITHNLMDFAEPTGNIYESLVIMGKRANQISAQMKEDLSRKLKEFASGTDTLEETFENREQIEISRYYERLPKSTLIAAEDFCTVRSTSAIHSKSAISNSTTTNSLLGTSTAPAVFPQRHRVSKCRSDLRDPVRCSVLLLFSTLQLS